LVTPTPIEESLERYKRISSWYDRIKEEADNDKIELKQILL
jgi:hypothetical protein